MNRRSFLRAYLFIKRNRIRKKSKIYKQAMGVMIDPVIAVYLIPLIGYVIVSFFIAGDFIGQYHDAFIVFETAIKDRFWLIASVLPLRYAVQSFTRPGIVFPRAEYLLGMLTFKKSKIWFAAAAEKWLRLIILYMIAGCVFVLMFPISARLIFTYILLLLLIDILMTIPQWKLFQLSILKKSGLTAAIITIMMTGVFLSPFVTAMMIAVLLPVINMYLSAGLFRDVNWGRVMEISDFHIWKMPFIGKVSETKFQWGNKYSFFQNRASARKPLQYTEKAIQRRLWQIYLKKNIDLIIRTIGTLFVMLVIFPFVNGWAPYLGIAVAIHVYTSVASSFFKERFESDIVSVLPWDLQVYKRTFLNWVVYGSLVLLVPVCVFLAVSGPTSGWALTQLLLICTVFLSVYELKVNKMITILAKKQTVSTNTGFFGFLLLMLVFLSGSFPPVALSFLIILYLPVKNRLTIRRQGN
jgi:hypothetical protein